jgi:hypothetical protein
MTLSHPHAGAPPVLVVGTATIVMDSATLAQVQTALGAPSIAGDKTGFDRLVKACYVAGAGNDRVTVRLSAQGNVDHEATMQEALATMPVNKAAIARGDVIGAGSSTPKRCARLSVPAAEIRWVGGLRLGMTRVEMERLLGTPTDSSDGEWKYEYDDRNFREVSVDTVTRKEVMRMVYVGVGVRVRYDRDVATRIEGWYFKDYARPEGETIDTARSSAKPVR